VQSLVDRTLKRYGRLDAAFNHAGYGHEPVPLAELAIDHFDQVTAVNLRGVFLAMKFVQVVANPEQVILAAQVTQSHNDADQLAPMVAHAAGALREAGVEEPIGTVLADGGYWNSPAISDVRGKGIEVLVPTRDRRRTAPRKLSPRQGEEARRIEAVLSTPEGNALYRRRQQIVEPVFAHIKSIRRTDRFLRRGLEACQAEG
jgi:NAD(P)-dependent dehydrogenase (short-subunit alcohol dehydrogenase family)